MAETKKVSLQWPAYSPDAVIDEEDRKFRQVLGRLIYFYTFGSTVSDTASRNQCLGWQECDSGHTNL